MAGFAEWKFMERKGRVSNTRLADEDEVGMLEWVRGVGSFMGLMDPGVSSADRAEANRVFSTIDKDDSGEIDPDELLEWLGQI